MSKRRRRTTAVGESKHRKLTVTPKFKKAIGQLMAMNKSVQRQVVNNASNQFIRDFSRAVTKLRSKPHLVSAHHKRLLRPHKEKLRVLADGTMPVIQKRAVLNQKGGFVISALLIPIIAAAIGAGGSVAGAAVHAAVSKS